MRRAPGDAWREARHAIAGVGLPAATGTGESQTRPARRPGHMHLPLFRPQPIVEETGRAADVVTKREHLEQLHVADGSQRNSALSDQSSGSGVRTSCHGEPAADHTVDRKPVVVDGDASRRARSSPSDRRLGIQIRRAGLPRGRAAAPPSSCPPARRRARRHSVPAVPRPRGAANSRAFRQTERTSPEAAPLTRRARRCRSVRRSSCPGRSVPSQWAMTS